MSAAADGSLTRTVVRGAGLAGAGHLLTQMISFVSFLVLARLATPVEWGQYSAGALVAGVGILISESGMLASVIRERDDVEEAANTALVATVGGGVLLGLAALAVSPVVGYFFHSRRIGEVSAALAGMVVLRQATVVPDALLQRRFSFARRVAVEPAGAIAFGAAATILTASGLGVWGLVLGTYATMVSNLVLSWSFARWRPNLRRASVAKWRAMAAYGRHIVASEAVRVGNLEALIALVGRVLGAAALGQYTYGVRIARQPLMIVVNAVAYVLMPALSRLTDDDARFREAALRSLRWTAIAVLPASLILLPLGEPGMVLVFGERWRPAGDAAAAMFALSAGGAMLQVASEIWKAAGRPEWLPRANGVAAVLSVGLAAALSPFGLTAVGAGLSIAAFGSAAYALYGIARVVDAPFARALQPLGAPVAASVLMAAAVFAVELAVRASAHATLVGLALLAGEAALGVAVYLAALAVLAPSTVREVLHALRRRRSVPA